MRGVVDRRDRAGLDHHVLFRSRGGDNARENRVAVCAWHHLGGLHAGIVRAFGDAPHGLEAAIEHAHRFVGANPPPPSVRVLVAGGMGAATVAINDETTRGKVLAVGGGYALLSPFSFLPLRLFGILIPITMFVACVSAVTLIPSILSLTRPAFLRSGASPRATRASEVAERRRREVSL